MTKRTYRKFSPEFKREAVRLAEQTDGPVTQVARELGIRSELTHQKVGALGEC
jgi:transposase-like protein